MTHCNRHSSSVPRIALSRLVFIALAVTLATTAAATASRDDHSFKWVHGHKGTADKPLGPPVPRPIVIWHGMGDAAHSEGMSHVASRLAAALPPGTPIHSIQVGRDDNDDRKRSYLDNLTHQVAQVCRQLQSIPAPAGFHAIGFSQGGLFLRAIAQKCPQVRMQRLITWASPHQGIADVPPTWCKGQPMWCGIARTALRRGAYVKGVQTRVVQAGYVKTPANLEAYRRGNLFLPDINNENNVDAKYAEQISALEKIVLIKHADDTVLSPPETAWFSELTPDLALVPLFNTTLYTDDTIGLQAVDKRGDLVMLEVPGDHMQFSVDLFLNVMLPFLAPQPSADAGAAAAGQRPMRFGGGRAAQRPMRFGGGRAAQRPMRALAA